MRACPPSFIRFAERRDEKKGARVVWLFIPPFAWSSSLGRTVHLRRCVGPLARVITAAAAAAVACCTDRELFVVVSLTGAMPACCRRTIPASLKSTLKAAS